MTLKLIIINGPSGVGKSTISARIHTVLQDSLIIDIDELRRRIPDYRENREASLKLSYEHASHVIEKNLQQEKSVVIDKAIFDTKILDSFIELGKRYNAQIFEFLLYADKETLLKRAAERGYRPGSLLTSERVAEMWGKADTLRKEKLGIICIDTTTADAEAVFQQIKQTVAF